MYLTNQKFTVFDPLASATPASTPYHYVSNNPISLVDPSGMFAEHFEGEDAKKAFEVFQRAEQRRELSTYMKSAEVVWGGSRSNSSTSQDSLGPGNRSSIDLSNTFGNLQESIFSPAGSNLVASSELLVGSAAYNFDQYMVQHSTLRLPQNYRFNLFGSVTLRGATIGYFGNALRYGGAGLTLLGISASWQSQQSTEWKVTDTIAGVASLAKGGFVISAYYLMIKSAAPNFSNANLETQQQLIAGRGVIIHESIGTDD